MADEATTSAGRWLLLIHQLPPKPDYLRVKVARRMQRIGAVAVKNTVYVLPATEAALEDYQWAIRDIRAAGGEANLFEARVIEGLTDAQVQQLFLEARDADYAPVVSDARNLLKAASRKRRDDPQLNASLQRLRKRVGEIAAIDFFGAPQGHAATALLDDIEQRLSRSSPPSREKAADRFRARTWVTRTGVHVDRMASAWLIKRFIDAKASFKFVSAKEYRPATGQVRFDMFDADFTHEGDHCTFEVLLERFALIDRALRPIAEIVHDIDLKDAKFDRAETAGLAVAIAGIAMAHADDASRLRRSEQLFDDLYVYYSRKGR